MGREKKSALFTRLFLRKPSPPRGLRMGFGKTSQERTRFASTHPTTLRHSIRFLFMQNNAFERITRVLPGFALQHTRGVGIAGFPAAADTLRTEVDVLGVIFVFQTRRQEPHDILVRQPYAD